MWSCELSLSSSSVQQSAMPYVSYMYLTARVHFVTHLQFPPADIPLLIAALHTWIGGHVALQVDWVPPGP